jgi:hypothetical protein
MLQWQENLCRAIGLRLLKDYYVKDELLGQGSFGKVFRGYALSNPRELVAIKYIDKKSMKALEISL